MSNIVKSSEVTTADQCTWIGKGEGCTQTTVPGRNYCEDHIWLVYNKGTAVKPRKKKEAQRVTAQEIIHDLNELYNEMLDAGEISA
jgi:hypothetical protein